MGLINILVKSKKAINWYNLSKSYSELNLNNIEMFPIPKELGFEHDGIGVGVHKGYLDKKIVLQELKLLIDFFTKRELTMIELYDGLEISSDNAMVIFDKLLPST